jgi:hypothetical protein
MARPIGSGRKLSASQEEAIRRRYAAGGITRLEIAILYGVSEALIGIALRPENRERWLDNLRRKRSKCNRPASDAQPADGTR